MFDTLERIVPPVLLTLVILLFLKSLAQNFSETHRTLTEYERFQENEARLLWELENEQIQLQQQDGFLETLQMDLANFLQLDTVNSRLRRRKTAADVFEKVYKEKVRDREYKPEEASTNTCSICMDSFSVGDAVNELPCGHVFHAKCIGHWFFGYPESRYLCPYCRDDVYYGLLSGEI